MYLDLENAGIPESSYLGDDLNGKVDTFAWRGAFTKEDHTVYWSLEYSWLISLVKR
jgi:hypothetical protein